MKRVLIAKEWAGMRPFVWLQVGLTLVGFVELAVGDLFALHRTATGFDAHWKEAGLVQLLLAFAMGSGLLAREIEEGTLSFLDGLPLPRRDVFLAKLSVAGACLFAFAFYEPVSAWALHQVLRHSIDDPVAAGTMAALAVRFALLVTAGLALGLLFGFVRHLSWALFAIAAAAVSLLQSVWPRAAAALDPSALVADGWSTQGVKGDGPWTVAALAVICLALAYGLFAYAGGAGMLRLARLAQRRSVMAGLYAGAIALGIAAALAARDAPEKGGDPVAAGMARAQDARAPAAPGLARKVVTPHYTFNVPAGLAVDDGELQAADAAFFIAARALSLTVPDVERIDVDLSGSIDNTDGLASHKRIRASVHPGWRNTLVHETVHVLEDLLAGPEHRTELDRMHLFDEGLAHWAEPARRMASPEERGAEELAVATVFRRRLLDQGGLLDAQALQRSLDWEMVYPLGARLIDALVARYGKDAPLRVLAALNQAAFPRGLAGYDLYRSAFQLAGYDVNLVLNDYAAALRQLDAAHGPAIDALPRPRGLLVRDGGRVGIMLRLDRPVARGERFLVRFRDRDDSPIEDLAVIRQLDRSRGGPIAWIPPALVAHDRVCYQVGAFTGFANLYEPWSCLPLRVAMDAPARRR